MHLILLSAGSFWHFVKTVPQLLQFDGLAFAHWAGSHFEAVVGVQVVPVQNVVTSDNFTTFVDLHAV
jgi:hypothetical protein